MSLIKALTEIKQISFGKDKKGYGYDYTTYDNLVNKINPILSKHNLALIHTMTVDNEITTKVINEENKVLLETTTNYLPWTDMTLKGQNKIQIFGSIQSYIKRYQVVGLFGIATNEKDIDDIEFNAPDNVKINNDGTTTKPPVRTVRPTQPTRPTQQVQFDDFDDDDLPF